MIDVIEFRQQWDRNFKDPTTGPQWIIDILKYVYQGSPMRGQQFYFSDTASPMKPQVGYRSSIVSPMRGQQHYISKVISPMRGWELKNLAKVSYRGGAVGRSAFAGLIR